MQYRLRHGIDYRQMNHRDYRCSLDLERGRFILTDYVKESVTG